MALILAAAIISALASCSKPRPSQPVPQVAVQTTALIARLDGQVTRLERYRRAAAKMRAAENLIASTHDRVTKGLAWGDWLDARAELRTLSKEQR
jgi:tellurite resistance protein